MFTPFNAKSVDLGAKKINAFFDKPAVSADDCPPDSYFTYTQLKDAGMMPPMRSLPVPTAENTACRPRAS